MTTEIYINALKEIKKFSKEDQWKLTDDIIICILQEIGKDYRCPDITQKSVSTFAKTSASNNPKRDVEDIEKASSKQLYVLNQLGIDFDENITKQEAFEIIKKNKEQYDHRNNK